MRSVAELQEVKALELVAYFHRSFGRSQYTRFADHETAYADELLATHTDAEIRGLIDYAADEAPKTKWEPLFFGALKKYVDEWSASEEHRKERQRRAAIVENCPYCNTSGFLDLKEQGTGRLFVHLCPHKLEHVEKIEDGLKAYRI